MVHLARCCTPVPGDQIVGFVTQGRGVSVHRADCSNAAALSRRSQERLIEVEWDRGSEGVFLATLEVLAFDRSRLLADVSRVGLRAPPEHRGRPHRHHPGPGEPDGLRRGAGRPHPPAVAHRLAQAPRRRVRRLPSAARQEGVGPPWPTSAGPPRAPPGTHDVLWPESCAGRRLVAAVRRPGRAGRLRPAQTPLFEYAAVFRRGIGEGSDVVGKEMYEFADRDGQLLALRPEGTASIVRAFVQHHPVAALQGVVRDAGLPPRAPPGRPLPPAPPGGRGGHRPGRPRPRRRGGGPGRTTSTGGSGLSRLHLEGQLDGRRDVPAGLRRAAAARLLAERRDQLCDEHRERLDANPLRVLDCKRDGVPPGHRGRPAAGRPPLRTLRRPLRPGPPRARGASGAPASLDHRLVRGFDYYTRTTFEFASRAIDARPERASAAAAATTAWSRCWGARPPRASASASASSGCCWPATPRGCSPPSPAAPTPSWSTWPAATAPGTWRPRCAGPGWGPTGPSTGAP